MSVLAQVAIDSAKRRFDINVTDEIHRIKKDMQVKENGYPAFWLSIRKDFNHKLINRKLKCPMNNIYRKTFRNAYPDNSTIPFADFFVYHAMDWDKKQAKRIEALIEDFSLNLFQSRIDDETADDDEEYILLKNDYEEMIARIRRTSFSKNQQGLMSWLINRAFVATPMIQANCRELKSKLSKNKAILMKTLYDVNKEIFFSCFFAPPIQK